MLNYFFWRRLHACNDCMQYPHIQGERFEEFHIDMGYCLDRYTLDMEDGTPKLLHWP